MCHLCLHELSPERYTFVSDICNYLLNYKSCADCKNHTTLLCSNKQHTIEVNEEENEGNDDDDDGKNDSESQSYTEHIQYTHECADCKHMVALHQYRFHVYEDEQFYFMKCQLCGKGQYTSNISTSQSLLPQTSRSADTHIHHDRSLSATVADQHDTGIYIEERKRCEEYDNHIFGRNENHDYAATSSAERADMAGLHDIIIPADYEPLPVMAGESARRLLCATDIQTRVANALRQRQQRLRNRDQHHGSNENGICQGNNNSDMNNYQDNNSTNAVNDTNVDGDADADEWSEDD